jgi:MYXO-CTERM domain-containing protein
LLAATTGLLISQGEAKALNLKTFDLQWTPQSGSVGTVSGSITLDVDAIPFPVWPPASLPNSWATGLSVTVSGVPDPDSLLLNRTFQGTDFVALAFDNDSISFDYTQDLIGQNGFGTTCISNLICDFNIFAAGPGVPMAYNYFEISQGGNRFLLTKFAPAASGGNPDGPTATGVPGPLPLLGAGAAFGWSRRLRKRIATPLITPPLA